MRPFVTLLLLTLAMPAAADTLVVTSPTVDGLALTAKVSAVDLNITLTLTNKGKKPVAVLSHVQTDEKHFDYYTIELTWPKADPKTQVCAGTGKVVLELWDSRDKSAPVTVTLAPGKSLSHTLSIPEWAKRGVNRAVLGGSFYKIVTRYRVQNSKGVWNGELVTPPAKLFGLDQMRTDVCRKNPGWNRW